MLHKGQWRGAWIFSLICVWMNGWENNRETGDLRRYRANYDIIVKEHDILTMYNIFWAMLYDDGLIYDDREHYYQPKNCSKFDNNILQLLGALYCAILSRSKPTERPIVSSLYQARGVFFSSINSSQTNKYRKICMLYSSSIHYHYSSAGAYQIMQMSKDLIFIEMPFYTLVYM